MLSTPNIAKLHVYLLTLLMMFGCGVEGSSSNLEMGLTEYTLSAQRPSAQSNESETEVPARAGDQASDRAEQRGAEETEGSERNADSALRDTENDSTRGRLIERPHAVKRALTALNTFGRRGGLSHRAVRDSFEHTNSALPMPKFSCDTNHDEQPVIPARVQRRDTAPVDEDGVVTKRILVVPVTYRRPGRRDGFDANHAAIGEHYPEMISSTALAAELFGHVNRLGQLIGPGHLKHYLEQLMEGQVEIQGQVSAWAYVDKFAPLEPHIDKCGTDLFHYEAYPEDHPQYDSSHPGVGRYVSPILEEALLDIGIDNVDEFETLGLVTACNETVMRGEAVVQGVEVFGKRVGLATSSHPHYSNMLEYWSFPGAMEVSSVSRNMIHEVLHTWHIYHSRSTDCDEHSFGSDCNYVRYGSPFSVMGNPIGMYSLDVMDRIKLGVLSEDNVVHITETGNYVISGLNDTSAVHRGAYLYWPGTDIPRLAVQFRTGLGYDASIGDNWIGHVSTGLTVHVNTSSSTDITQINEGHRNWFLVDPKPNNSADEQFDSLSVITDSFEDPYTGISIEILNVGADSIEFRVVYGPAVN